MKVTNKVLSFVHDVSFSPLFFFATGSKGHPLVPPPRVPDGDVGLPAVQCDLHRAALHLR